jgi:hypothetical protein
MGGMERPNTVAGLVAKRAEIAGKIENLQDQLRELVIALDHVDATIHIFDPSIELEDIRARPVPPAHHAFRGEVTRIVLTTLRDAPRPLTTAEIAQEVMMARGLDVGNKRLAKAFLKRVGACLRHWQVRGTISAAGERGGYKIWRTQTKQQ